MLLIRAAYCTFRYAAYLYDLSNESAWEQRNSVIYYAEFGFEVSVAVIDLFHHIHMLVSIYRLFGIFDRIEKKANMRTL